MDRTQLGEIRYLQRHKAEQQGEKRLRFEATILSTSTHVGVLLFLPKTVTLKTHIAVLKFSPTALQTTSVRPIGKSPFGGKHVTGGSPPELSKASGSFQTTQAVDSPRLAFLYRLTGQYLNTCGC